MSIVVRVLALLLVGAIAACNDKQICDPHSVRPDPYNAGAYRVCNGEGTDEKLIQGPTPESRPTKV